METGLYITQSQSLAPQMQLMLSVLSMNHQQLREYIQKEYEENPLLEMQEGVYSMDSRPAPGRQAAPLENAPQLERLQENLRAQLDIMHMTEREAKICRMVIALLDEDGFLREDLSEYTRLGHIGEDEIETAIREVQSLDPPGVGARDVPEYLCLLLARQGEQREIMYTLAREHYTLVAEEKYREIAENLGVSAAEARQMCEALRALRPASMGGETAPYVYPDIVVTIDEDGFHIGVSDLDISLSLADPSVFSKDALLSREDRAYLREKKRKAFQTVRAVEMRNMTLRQTAELLVSEQRDFFLGKELRPLLQSSLAGTLGVHASTVSRAVKGKWLLCDRGMFPLSYFFMREVDGEGRETVKERLRSIIRQQPGLSDRALCEVLAEQGIHIARRTVSKYRQEMGLSDSRKRKKP